MSSRSAERSRRADPDLIADDLLDQATPDELERYAAFLRRELHREDPARWVSERLDEYLWSGQVKIAESVRDNAKTAVRSCHSAGKSYTAGRIAAWWIDTHEPGEAFVVTTAPTFPQVRAILWKEIGRAHRHGALVGTTNQTEWWLDEELVGMGRKPSDYDEAAFQGIHARYVLVIIDEASGVPENIWTAAESIASNRNARILAIGNPDDPTSEFARVCRPNSGWHRIRIRAEDTPNFTGEAVPESLSDDLLDPAWVKDKAKRWGKSSPLYISKVDAEFPDVSDDTLIPLGWATRAAERKLKPTTPNVLGVDIARYGSDESVVAHRMGPVVRIRDRWRSQDTMTTTGKIVQALRRTKATAAHVDVVGIGAGVVDRLQELREPVREASAGDAPRDKEQYLNARAEWYWGLRERFESGDIDIESDNEELLAQLTSIKYKVTSRGQIQIESKEDMRKRGLDSPDLADAVVIAFAADLHPPAAGGSIEPPSLEERRQRSRIFS